MSVATMNDKPTVRWRVVVDGRRSAMTWAAYPTSDAAEAAVRGLRALGFNATTKGTAVPYEQREMSGSLFKNRKRETDAHPQATGTALIGGVEYWVNAWTKRDKNGNPWQSLSFKRKDARAAAPAAPAAPKPASDKRHDDDLESDIPF
jgi:hypothetical protein